MEIYQSNFVKRNTEKIKLYIYLSRRKVGKKVLKGFFKVFDKNPEKISKLYFCIKKMKKFFKLKYNKKKRKKIFIFNFCQEQKSGKKFKTNFLTKKNLGIFCHKFFKKKIVNFFRQIFVKKIFFWKFWKLMLSKKIQNFFLTLIFAKNKNLKIFHECLC